jgi:hypothetical protein
MAQPPLEELSPQNLKTLWHRVRELKREGYSLSEIAYLVDRPIKTIKVLFEMEKPKKS